MVSVRVSDAWRQTFPGARVGLLVLHGVQNPSTYPVLEERVRDIEATLRQRFATADRSALTALPAIQAYRAHYRAFGQTYHVLRQLESVALKDRHLSSSSALVLAMFAAELESLLLTAGHDLDLVQPPLVLDCSAADEGFVGIGGQEHVVRAGDMLMRDAAGIISAVVYGPDRRTRLGDQTRRALFTTYAPPGIDSAAVGGHLTELAALVKLIAPSSTTALLEVYPADVSC